ncbi:cellular tumor antigen p53 isoform X2 [Nilaparvata lugens]|uniref:cellular tumor antigen p53 isoform X2 n=1 Tax=Nilaparvata lugens TaxID=108931 RepID=UPI00193E660C|nr:cellular tumor antigen p53 isoform X2 [Nilaparvata lugens]
MELMNSQESEIINEGELNYIMSDLNSSQPYLFLQGNEYVDLYSSAHQQQLLRQQQMAGEQHQMQQQHLTDDQQFVQQHLTSDQQMQQQQIDGEQHLSNDQQFAQQHLADDQQHLSNDQQFAQQHLADDQQHLSNDQQFAQQHLTGDQPQLNHLMSEPAPSDDSKVGIISGSGGEMVRAPPYHDTTPSEHTSPTGLRPCLTIQPGVYDFQVNVANTLNGRHAWVYSSKLQKIYIDIDKVLLMQFRLNRVDVKGLSVRTLLVYSDPDHATLAVNRCTLHVFKCDPNRLAHADPLQCQCSAFDQCGHVVTSDHPQARYEFDTTSGRHSVLVPMDTTPVAYQFGCKTSCAAGMSRRPVQLVFTLESQFGEVVGRARVPVKICSCPKRDKDREESGEVGDGERGGNTKASALHSLHAKKRKLTHQSGAGSKLMALNESTKDLCQLPAIGLLLEEVQKLHAKFDQLSSKVDHATALLREIASGMRQNKQIDGCKFETKY